jgi:PIN domain nuclease of toxin-antitoxin system
MRLLLDTHALLWWQTDDERLSTTARAAIADASNEILVSAASAWEIATKIRLGKLGGVPEAATRFGELVNADGFHHLPVTHIHALRAGSYALEHRDPFDRMLAAQSAIERLALVTCDEAFAAFPVTTLW